MVLYDKKLSSDYVKNRNSYTNTDKRVFECIESIGGVKNKKVLDLGCGNGRYSNKFSDMGALSVTGVDISPEMIALARNNILPNINFIETDATNLPFKDEEFDFIFSNFVLHHVKNIKKAFEEIKRVLKKDGILVTILNTYNIDPNNEDIHYTEIPINLSGENEIVKVTNLIIPDKDLKKIVSDLGFLVLMYEYQPNPYAVINPNFIHKNKLEKLTPLIVLKK